MQEFFGLGEYFVEVLVSEGDSQEVFFVLDEVSGDPIGQFRLSDEEVGGGGGDQYAIDGLVLFHQCRLEDRAVVVVVQEKIAEFGDCAQGQGPVRGDYVLH